ncbi:jg2112, partial [Pararge aegeria aegeria]
MDQGKPQVIIYYSHFLIYYGIIEIGYSFIVLQRGTPRSRQSTVASLGPGSSPTYNGIHTASHHWNVPGRPRIPPSLEAKFCKEAPPEVVNLLWLRLVLAPPLLITVSILLLIIGMFLGVQGFHRLWKP